MVHSVARAIGLLLPMTLFSGGSSAGRVNLVWMRFTYKLPSCGFDFKETGLATFG